MRRVRATLLAISVVAATAAPYPGATLAGQVGLAGQFDFVPLGVEIAPPATAELPALLGDVAALPLDPATATLDPLTGVLVPAMVDASATAASVARTRLDNDFGAMAAFRPGYAFWQHIYTIPDGSVIFGSAEDGRLLATFPLRGDWTRTARWDEPWLAGVLEGRRLPSAVDARRTQVAELLEPQAGRVIHNETRGNFLMPNVRLYGGFLGEWGEIFERFGVPAEIGIAQAIVESGLNGRIRSEARALGLCQWLPQNWERMKRLAHHVIEGYNQTSQAPYCAAYLSILATKYGSFIPALSEHHAGGTNVARVLISGERLGGADVRERYFLGSQLALDLRDISPRTFSDVYGTYGPRSYRYAEIIFGNTGNVRQLRESIPQEKIYAMRTRRAISLDEVARRTRLSTNEIKRYNPALVRQVPARADLYLPMYIADFGADVSFWHRPPPAEYAATLDAFLSLDASLDQWNDPAFREVLNDFQRRFTATNTEEGHVMATALAYFMEETYTGPRASLLAEYESSPQILRLFERGVAEREARNPATIAAQ